MGCYLTLILLFFGLSFISCSQYPPRKYYYVNLEVGWSDAQHYCREKYTDLATIESTDDISRLKSDFSYSWAWIGLSDDPQSWRDIGGNDINSWKWSSTGKTSKTSYQNWQSGDPNNGYGIEHCVAISSAGTWTDWNCESLLSFVCYTATNQNDKTYEFIDASKTWTSAQAYCRKHYTDLATVENTEENNQVVSANSGHADVWIGLYRVPWTWSDKTQSSFRSWRRDSPNNVGGDQFCVVESTEHVWDDDNCQVKYPFICHQVSKLKNTVRMEIQTEADLSNPAAKTQILQQLGAVLTSQGWTDFNLQLTIQPRKQETKKLSVHQCILKI